jgi:hypothetical protein
MRDDIEKEKRHANLDVVFLFHVKRINARLTIKKRICREK